MPDLGFRCVAVANSLTTMFNFLVDLPGLDITLDDRRECHRLSI